MLSGWKRRSGLRSQASDPVKLNESEANVYFSVLWSILQEEQRQTCFYIDPILLSKYYKEIGDRNSVLRWFSRNNFEAKKYIFFPICFCNHWVFVVLCNPGNSLDGTEELPCMVLLDSLKGSRTDLIEKFLRGLLVDYFEYKQKSVTRMNVDRIPLLTPAVPKQKDALSCGYFVLLYATLFLQSCPDTFSATKGYPYFIKKSWFSDETIESFRDPLKKLFSELVVNVPLVPGNNPTLENKITTLIRSYWSPLGTGRRFADNGEKHNSCGVEEITKMPNNCKRSRAISKEIGESIKISKESMERQKILRGSLEDCEFPKSTEFKMPNNYKQSRAIIKEIGESINISKESKESQKVLRGSLEECEFPNSTEFKELRKDLDYYQYLQRQLVVHVVAASKNKETNSTAQDFMKRFIQMNQDYNNLIGFLVDKNK